MNVPSGTCHSVTRLSGATLLATGTSYVLTWRDSDASAWAWGDNRHGQLGDESTVDRSSPVVVARLSGVSFLAGGQGHSLAVHTDGTVSSWGDNTYGQLGDDTTDSRLTAAQVPQLSSVTAVAAGVAHSLVTAISWAMCQVKS